MKKIFKINATTLMLTCLLWVPQLFTGLNPTAQSPQTSEGIYGTDFNGIYPFDNYTLGSDPWLIPDGYGADAEIKHTYNGHSYIYELNNALRRIFIIYDMSGNWKIESYVSLSNINYVSGGAVYAITLRAANTNWILWGYTQYEGNWVRNYKGASNTNIQSAENWSSNSWMYWRIEFTTASDTYRFYINNTLLDTVIYSGINVLNYIEFTSGSWGNAGAMRIDSLCYSWHPSYYDDMIFDVVNEDTDGDGMPDDWETENSLDPEDDTDALIDSDTDGLLNLYEYGNSTDPQDADSDNDLLNDGPEVKTHLTDPNDADSDNDGLNDGAEVNTYSTDPNDADSDNDALTDGAEINTYSTDPNDADSDNDQLNDYIEVMTYSTDPNDPDSDADGFNDKAEIEFGTNPNDTLSYPGRIDPQRFTVFLILIIVAGFIGIGGAFLRKKQHKQRFVS